MDYIPATIADLIDVIGTEAVRAIVNARGGRELKVPVKYSAGHWLNPIIGETALRTLIEHYSGEQFYLPNCKNVLARQQQQKIIEASNRGARTVDLAGEFNVSDRWVRAIKARAKAETETQQIDLFKD